jgi:hypothetical protein
MLFLWSKQGRRKEVTFEGFILYGKLHSDGVGLHHNVERHLVIGLARLHRIFDLVSRLSFGHFLILTHFTVYTFTRVLFSTNGRLDSLSSGGRTLLFPCTAT